MSNRVYICANCGAVRRASAVYIDGRQDMPVEAIASPRPPTHCGQPMKQLSFVQAEAATQLTQEERVKWVAKGMHILRQHQHGKHKWKAVSADWQIEEAKRQEETYHTRLKNRADLVRRRIPASILTKRSGLSIEET